MRYAETGFNLEVDLSRGSIDRVETDPELTELHLGGLGTSARILWDRVPPETEAFSDDNLLIFSTGLLCGTRGAGLQPHHRLHLLAADPAAGLLDDGRLLGAGAEARRLRQGDHPRQVARAGLPLDPQRQGRDPRRRAPARQGRRSRPPSCIRQELKEPEGPGGRHRPGRREPGLLRLHRAGPVQRQPRRHRRGHGRQGAQGDRRARHQGRQRRPAGRVHGALQRGAGVHQVPRRQPDPGRDADPGRARLAAGDEAHRRGVAHHQLHVGQRAHPAQGLLDPGDRGEVARDAGERAHAPDQLLQLPDEVRRDHLGAGAARPT